MPAVPGEMEIYDILADPTEKRNLASDKALLAKLMKVVERVNAVSTSTFLFPPINLSCFLKSRGNCWLQSEYAEPLINTPANPYGCQANHSCCPYSVAAPGYDKGGVLTPCP